MRRIKLALSAFALVLCNFAGAAQAAPNLGGASTIDGLDPTCGNILYRSTSPGGAQDCCLQSFDSFYYCPVVITDARQSAAATRDAGDIMTYAFLAAAKAHFNTSNMMTAQDIFWGTCVVSSSLGWIAGGGDITQADDEAIENCSNY